MGDQGFTLRTFTVSDLERVMHINTKCLPENYSSFFYKDLYTRFPETFVVAEMDGEIQGYLMCRIEKGWSKRGRLSPARLCHVVSIAVMEDYRRKGMGIALVKEGMSRGRKTYDCNEGYLEVRVGNEAAVNLYDKLDFTKVKRNYGYYLDGEDAWLMAAPLDKF